MVLLLTVQFIGSQTVHAQETPLTLAETINSVLTNIKETNSSWNTIFDQVFCRQNASVFDAAASQALEKKDYQNVIYIARLAELNNYTSQNIIDCLTVAMQSIPMCGSLPITYNNPNSFLLYDRYMVNAYRYAQELGIPGWDINKAYSDFVKAYLTMPQSSESGEMLWINPQQNTSYSYSSRYYDEHAETLSMFLLFALNGIDGSMAYADDAWLNVQTHWNGEYYGYTNKNGGVECEMGNFAQVISQYRNNRGDIPYFDLVIKDLEDTLLTNEYNSTAWGSPGVIQHAQSVNQKRLYETMGNLIALQMLYPYFTEGNQTHFQNMLLSGWQGLVNSSLFSNNQFSFMDLSTNGTAGDYNDEASLLGAMTLFLYGIIPQTGSLAMNANNEKYQDYLTCFQTSQWQFNYADCSIRIPVNKGNLTFIFGTQNVTYDFMEDGVYNIQFSSDWNNVTSTVKIEDITHPELQPVTLQNIPKQPKPTPTPTAPPTITPTPSAAPSSTPETTPTPTATPTVEPSSEGHDTLTASPDSGSGQTSPFTMYLAAVLAVSLTVAFSAGALRYVRGKSKQKPLS